MSRFKLAVDLGSTTIGYAVVDVASDEIIKEDMIENPGRLYGRDIFSRIGAYRAGGSSRITSAMRETILDIVNVVPGEVTEIVVSGNTTMNHMLLGLSCDGLGQAPYSPVTLEAGQLLLISENGRSIPLRTLPGFSAFVGGDIVSGVRALDMDKADRPCLLIDLGTNGEMVLGCSDGFTVTSVAAGPAFEEWGLTRGMYGSKVIDVISNLIKTGIIRRDGTFSNEEYISDGFPISPVGKSMVLTQDDVRDIQLAKAAVRAGVEILFKKTGMGYSDVDRVYIAGGMGEHLDIASACAIGMLPEEFGIPLDVRRQLDKNDVRQQNGRRLEEDAGRVVSVGNTSLVGAVAELRSPDGDRLSRIAGMGHSLLLSDDPGFNDAFVKYMDF